MPTQLIVNGRSLSTRDDTQTPLLWVLRDTLGLTGTKFDCGIAPCGACTVLVNGEAVRSCVTPVARVAGKRITTVEGLSGDNSHPVQEAWAAEQVSQCGYCQPERVERGPQERHTPQMMSAAALIAVNRDPSDADIDNALSGNICRCGTYVRIRKAIHRAAAEMRGGTR
jgi:aerobic-type carbon monoxide dehydrogenase small subunit (CoxS/CutS family)